MVGGGRDRMTPAATPEPLCEHRALFVHAWDFATGTMTYRCVHCGEVLDRLTTRERRG